MLARRKIAETLKSIEPNRGINNTEKKFVGSSFRGTDRIACRHGSPRLKVDAVLVKAPADPADAKPAELESISASLIPAELLLADTGSAVVRSTSVFDRLMNYLPPVCLIAAKKSQLREHLPHAWPELLARIGSDGEKTGEFLLITGPSRTADIEKILVLGVHGPRKVVVYLIENE